MLSLVKVYYELSSSTHISYHYRAFYVAAKKHCILNIQTHLIMVLTLVLFLAFSIIFPILLLFEYPFQHFQKLLLNKIPVRWHALHTFADVQGSYKDGSDHVTGDFRWFSCLFLIARIF